MLNILVTGCNGQLGKEISNISPMYSDYHYIFTDIDELDITNYEALENFFSHTKIDCIINCAAYTAVDKAETDTKAASLLNTLAVKYLSIFSEKYDSLLIHISTDYVFDGKNYKPYIESDKTNPLSVYGKTKLSGENQIISCATKAVIIRTSWLYSSYGSNFVKSIIKYAKEQKKLNIVFDQIGTPTYARDLAKAILDIITQIKHKKNSVEIYHYSNQGVISWYDFAKAIIEISNINCSVNPIETKDYPTPAPRPYYSILNKNKIKNHYNINIPYWKNSLKECIKKINEHKTV